MQPLLRLRATLNDAQLLDEGRGGVIALVA